MDWAAANNHLNVVVWLHENSITRCSEEAMNGAACNGHLDMVKYLHEHCTEGCTTRAMDDAATNGYFGVVMWLAANRNEGCTIAVVPNAVRSGNIEMTKWLHEKVATCSLAVSDTALSIGDGDTLRWHRENCEQGCTPAPLGDAAAAGNIELLEYVRQKYHELPTSATFLRAVQAKQLYAASWVRQYTNDDIDDDTYQHHFDTNGWTTEIRRTALL